MLRSVQALSIASSFFTGRIAEMAARVPELVRGAVERNDVGSAMMFRCGGATAVWLARGDTDEAVRQADEAIRCWPQGQGHIVDLVHLLSRAYVEIYLGQGEAALARVEAAVPAFGTSMLVRTHYPRVTLTDVRGRAALAAAALASGRTRAARLAKARGLAKRLEREKAPWARALGLIVRAGHAALSGDRAAAGEHLMAAAGLADEIGMSLHAAAARLHAGRLRGGDAGAEMERSARAAFTAEEVVDPDRYAAFLAPGFGAA
jgi:hypothetical protein